MRSLGSMWDDTYLSWFDPITKCCGVREKPRHRESRSQDTSSYRTAGLEWTILTHADVEKPFVVLHDQPALIPPPSAQPVWPQERQYGRQLERIGGSQRAVASRGFFSGRRGLFATTSSRRPQISAPSNFRHLDSGAYQFASPGDAPRRPRPSSFRPLELSIYSPDNRISPMPLFEEIEAAITPPPAAHTSSAWDSNSATLTHERSISSMSFHPLARRNTDGAMHSDSIDTVPPAIPPRARARADSSPAIDRMLERIASALNERDMLQDEIDSLIERQSIYVSSRPSTAYGMHDIEPVPLIPALPAAAPSFAERLSIESHSRPQTAPAQVTAMSRRDPVLPNLSAAFYSPPVTPSFNQKVVEHTRAHDERSLEMPLAPPLPLVLRPPLRKKKSFSRVSNWLFPGDTETEANMRFVSVTNIPKPISDREGFYAPIEGMTRTSVDSLSTVSSWETEEEERQTVPTTAWSPGSSPAMYQGTPKETPDATPTMERLAIFGQGSNTHRPTSVGVAL